MVVAKLLQSISRGLFDPDASRVARVDREIDSLADDLDKDHEGVHYGPEEQEDLSDAGDASDVEDDLQEADMSDRVYLSSDKAGGHIMQHRQSGVLHFVSIDSKFACGRPVNSFYSSLAYDLMHEWPVCQQCRHAIGEEALTTFLEA